MTERPIIFSAPMVRALLAGLKTQTRRIVKPQPPHEAGKIFTRWYHPTVIDRRGDEQPGAQTYGAWTGDGTWGTRCPSGQAGDRLWVRETWAGPLVSAEQWEEVDDTREVEKPAFCQYAADGGPTPEFMDADDNLRQRWTPSIHMPRWASRIALEVTAVRVERLQRITRGDAMAEGCPFPNMADGPDARQWYGKLWEDINGPGSWTSNPWVWVVEFKRVTP